MSLKSKEVKSNRKIELTINASLEGQPKIKMEELRKIIRKAINEKPYFTVIGNIKVFEYKEL